MHGKIVVSSIDADARAHASMSNAHQEASGDGVVRGVTQSMQLHGT